MYRNNTPKIISCYYCLRKKTHSKICVNLSNKSICGVCYIYTALKGLNIMISSPFIKFGDTKYTIMLKKKIDTAFAIDLIIAYIGEPLFSYIYSLNNKTRVHNKIYIVGDNDKIKCARKYNNLNQCNNTTNTDNIYCLECEQDIWKTQQNYYYEINLKLKNTGFYKKTE